MTFTSLALIISGAFAILFSKWRIDKLKQSESLKTAPDEAQIPDQVVIPEPVITSKIEPNMYDFSTPKKAWHSARVIMDEMGLTGVIDKVTGISAKDLLCSCIYQESEFIPTAVGEPNSNGTIDYGLCQYNNGTIRGVPLWIGKGAAFKDINEVLTNPEKNVRIMVQTYKAGHLNWWSSFSTGAYKKWLKPSSKMWLLKS